jgi:hypothetical protein
VETRTETISDDYLRQQQELHKNPNYGVASVHYARLVKDVIERSGAKSLSDYGAGKQYLRRKLEELGVRGVEYRAYDPAFPEYGPPRPADLTCCIDVLEHIEPEYLDTVLDELRAITPRFGFFTIHIHPAGKVLADGRNAHLIQQPSSWWLPRLCQRFEIDHLQLTQGGFAVVVSPRKGG